MPHAFRLAFICVTAGACIVAALGITHSRVWAIPDTPIGSHMLDFELKDLDGTVHRLTDLRGKVVVIYSWSHLCEFSRAIDPYVEELIDKYAGKDVHFFGVDAREVFSPEPVRQYQQKYGFRLTILQDFRNYYLRDLKVKLSPEFFVVDQTGLLVFRGGFDDRPNSITPGSMRCVELTVDTLLDRKSPEIMSPGVNGCRIKNLIEAE